MRYPALNPDQLTPRQHEVAEAIHQQRPRALAGAFQALLYSPEVAERVHLLDQELRLHLRVPERLRALAVLVAAGRHRGEDAALLAEQEDIQQSGLDAAKVAALCAGKPPADLAEDEQLVYDYCMELTRRSRVSNVNFERLAQRLGREICLELVAVCGYTLFVTNLIGVTQTRDASGRT